MKRIPLFSAILIAAALSACGQPKGTSDASPSERKETGVPVRTAVVTIAAIPDIVKGYGSISGGPNSQASLAFAEDGRIASVVVSVGDRVRAGDVLARLDERPFQADADQAAASAAAARANLRKVLLGSRPQQLAQTNAQIAQAQTQYAVAHAQRIRQERLLHLGVASQADVDAAKAAEASARSQLEVLQQQQQTQTHPWQPDVDAARADLQQAEAAAAAARQKVAFASLTAPFSGVVVARLHNDGETVDTTTPVVEIASDAAAVFTAQFAPADAARIQKGQRAIVKAQGATETADGRVIAINPAQSDQRTVAVLIRLASQRAVLGPGTYGEAAIVVGSRSGLVVPSAAIVSDPATGSTQIFRRDEDRYTPVPVTVIASANNRTIIRGDGLKPGDTVVTQGAYELLNPQQPAKSDSD